MQSVTAVHRCYNRLHGLHKKFAFAKTCLMKRFKEIGLIRDTSKKGGKLKRGEGSNHTRSIGTIAKWQFS